MNTPRRIGKDTVLFILTLWLLLAAIYLYWQGQEAYQQTISVYKMMGECILYAPLIT